MTVHDRREPILDEEEFPAGTEPLLLQDLVREGLPPPLWRRTMQKTEKTAYEEEVDATEETPAALAAQPDSLHATPTSEISPTEAEESMEETELAKALERIRKLSFHYPAEEATASQIPEEEPVQSSPITEPAVEVPASTPPAEENSALKDLQPAATSSEEHVSIENHDITAVAPSELASTPLSEAAEPAQETRGESVANDDASSPSPSIFDGDFLRQFETLLFHEVERRVLAELEEKITQHLQKTWKEQVSLAVMRSLALEGIRLRETVSREIQTVLPEILQRVLHEGLDEALTPGLADDARQPSNS
ncbi:hypothetical protein AB4090_04375 [Acidithiobacillus sp. IBUN Pt1247-S3]|uniref:hypothetical protein n=1 Tax=Acidithiobacillus sp. IBUN Pt1247-S3 TaxID=3166642 RepID=UPI0034E592A7